MRGSPLVRTFLVLIALIGAALGIRSIAESPPPAPEPANPTAEESVTAPFFLTFSSAPQEVIIEASGQTVTLQPDAVRASGSLTLSGEHPAVFLTVRWADADASTPRFAKLGLEPPGRATLTRTFDGIGEIDDVWELHLHP